MSDIGAALNIGPAPSRSVAGIAAFKDRAGLLAALGQELATAIPATPSWVQAGEIRLSCLAPARYLATAARDAALPSRLAARLAGLAAVTDQSDMWASFVVSGDAARDMLARVVPVDLDAARFRPGDVALTRAGHLDVGLWCLAGQTFEIAVTRSLAADLAYVLQASARPG